MKIPKIISKGGHEYIFVKEYDKEDIIPKNKKGSI